MLTVKCVKYLDSKLLSPPFLDIDWQIKEPLATIYEPLGEKKSSLLFYALSGRVEVDLEEISFPERKNRRTSIDQVRHPDQLKDRVRCVKNLDNLSFLGLTLSKYFKEIGKLRGLKSGQVKEGVTDLVDHFEINHLMLEKIDRMKPQQRARLQAVAALIGEPDLILLDGWFDQIFGGRGEAGLQEGREFLDKVSKITLTVFNTSQPVVGKKWGIPCYHFKGNRLELMRDPGYMPVNAKKKAKLWLVFLETKLKLSDLVVMINQSGYFRALKITADQVDRNSLIISGEKQISIYPVLNFLFEEKVEVSGFYPAN